MYYAAFYEGSDEPARRHAHRPVLHVFNDEAERDRYVSDPINFDAILGDYTVALSDFEALTTVFDSVECHF